MWMPFPIKRWQREKRAKDRNLRERWGGEKEQMEKTQHIFTLPASSSSNRLIPCPTYQQHIKTSPCHPCIFGVRPKMVFFTFLTSHFLTHFPTLDPLYLASIFMTSPIPWKWSAQCCFPNLNFAFLSSVSVWTLHLTMTSPANLRTNPITILCMCKYRALYGTLKFPLAPWV